ncbi:isochorismatase family protein [Abortiporus biennis]
MPSSSPTATTAHVNGASTSSGQSSSSSTATTKHVTPSSSNTATTSSSTSATNYGHPPNSSSKPPTASTSTSPSTTLPNHHAHSHNHHIHPHGTNSTHIVHHHHQQVLLLIAVQKCMLAPPEKGGIPSSLTVGPNISLILHQARNAPHPPLIIHVRNCGDIGDPDEPNTKGWELIHTPLTNEPIIDKMKNNAFAGTKLGEMIKPTDEIIVVGMQSDFCIRATCSAALGRGNEVLLVKGAHGTYERLEAFSQGLITPAETVEKEIEEELEEAGVLLLDMEDLPSIFNDR